MSTAERDELVGCVLDERYRIIRRIGIGGTGIVFEAACTADGSTVAIKTLRPCFVDHIDLGERLRREVEVARAVRHPGIVVAIDDGVLTDGSPFMVMPLMHGESLSRMLLRRQRMQVDEIAVIASRTAAILHSAHCAGYVHRDVKPEHILMNRSATGDLTVHLLDFGVCSSDTAPTEERSREKGKVFGTPTYVSPEQASGEVDIDGRADLFSLGIVMYEALTGRVPFAGATVSKLLVRIIRENAPRVSEVVPDVDPEVDALIAGLMARKPCDRLPSARAVARSLAPHIGDRKMVERQVAQSVHAAARHTDTSPTVRCTALPKRNVA